MNFALLLTLALSASPDSPSLPAPSFELARQAAGGQLEALKRSLDAGIAVDQRDAREWTALHWAAVFDQPDAASMLLDRGADPNARAHLDLTPLHLAAMLGRAQMVGLLMRRGARVAARDVYGMTPLHHAADGPVAQALLTAGAPLEAADDRGMTPLHTARNGRVAKALLEKGANATTRALDGKMPVQRWVLDTLEKKGLLVYALHSAVRLKGESALAEIGIRNVSARPLVSLAFSASSPAAQIALAPALVESLGPGEWMVVKLALSRTLASAEGEHPLILAITSGGEALGSVELLLDSSRGVTPEDQGMIRLGKGSLRPPASSWQYAAWAVVPLLIVGAWFALRRRV